jgi:hypothetical protein
MEQFPSSQYSKPLAPLPASFKLAACNDIRMSKNFQACSFHISKGSPWRQDGKPSNPHYIDSNVNVWEGRVRSEQSESNVEAERQRAIWAWFLPTKPGKVVPLKPSKRRWLATEENACWFNGFTCAKYIFHVLYIISGNDSRLYAM